MYSVTREKVFGFLKALHYPTPGESVGAVQILALQGASLASLSTAAGAAQIKVGPDRVDRYDDLLFVVGSDAAGKSIFRAFRCTTQPGAYYTSKEPHPLGAANLVYGQHPYVKGMHNGREAFRGAGEINRIWRDRNADHRFSLGEQIYEGAFGINIHSGGSADSVGKHSAGCIALLGNEQSSEWQDFKGIGYAHLSGNTSLSVTLWRGVDFASWIQHGKAWMPVLYPGVKGEWVRSAQGVLALHGFEPKGSASGDYDNNMIHAVTAFQKRKGLVPDAIIGPKTWSALSPFLQLRNRIS